MIVDPERAAPIVVAVACALASAVWARSSHYRSRIIGRLEKERRDAAVKRLAKAEFEKDLHAAVLYGQLAAFLAIVVLWDRAWPWAALLFLLPAGSTFVLGRHFQRDARLAHDRSLLEQRAQAVLTQDHLAPKRWAARLAPGDLPDIPGFEVGRVYKAGEGEMAGDFFDVFGMSPGRFAAVIGDVSGHGIEPAITAFQIKYLLRVFLQRYRDPAQALEELNNQMSGLGREDEFTSVYVAVFDKEAGTLRYASAGHPTAFLWHRREIVPLKATGPLLMLDPEATYYSRDIELERGDLLLAYTDGLSEARSSDGMFGEERIMATFRRDPTAPADSVCKSLLEAAEDFSSGPLTDDVAILAIRKL
jgi:serine phosphatase RsbU (regulator of sigma subunit)